MGLSSSTKPQKVETLSPEQQQLLSFFTGGAAQGFPSALDAILTQLDPSKTQELFQQAVAEPALQSFQSEVIPSILQGSANLGAKGGSSIDRQLARAGERLEGTLAQQLAGLQFGQQQQGISNLLGLGQSALGQPAFGLQQQGLSPMAQFILGLTGAASQGVGAGVGAAAAASSADYKENINEYEDALEKVKDLKVKKYDYKEDFGGRKNCVGLIQEECPDELKVEQEGLKLVDVYGLASMLVQAVKELTNKVEKLEAKYGSDPTSA